MKKLLTIFAAMCLSLSAYSQSSLQSNTKQTVASPDNKVNFRLFQTNNRWIFLKLDTRNGKITLVQYSTEGTDKMLECCLNSESLVVDDLSKPGRFFLYPTENTFNFLLLDQEDGRVWQVQWDFDASKRGIWRIY